jgi:Mrp family chromosome partitioning ATPase
MAEIIAALKERASFVIIDSPPLVAFADAAVLAAHAGNALLVVRSGKTRQGELIEVVNTLDRVPARVLGAVLNMVPSRGPDVYPTRRRRRPDAERPVGRPSAPSGVAKGRRASAVRPTTDEIVSAGPDTQDAPVLGQLRRRRASPAPKAAPPS